MMKIFKTEDGVKQVLTTPQMYLGGVSKATAEILLSAMFSDAILLNEKKILYSQIKEWHVLSGLTNWTERNVFNLKSPLEIFQRIIPFPEGGVNSIRSEVLLTAFASQVFVKYDTQWYIVKVNEPENTIHTQLPLDFPFSVGFRMD